MHDHNRQSDVDASGLRIAMVVSNYHADVTSAMREAARSAFIQSGGLPHTLHDYPASGTFDLTAVCRAVAIQQHLTGQPAFDAIVAIGCVITGQTTHDQYIAHAVSQGLTAVTVQTGVPIAFGVLTCQSLEQARARTDKGAHAMLAAIESANTIRLIESTRGLR